MQFLREYYLDVDVDHNDFPINPPSGYAWESPTKPLPFQSQGVPPGKSDSVPVGVPEGASPSVSDGVPVGVPEGVPVGASQGTLVEAPVGEPLSAPEGVPMGAPFPPPQYEFVQDIIAPQAAPHVIPEFVHEDPSNYETDLSADHQVQAALLTTRARGKTVQPR